MNGFAGVVTAVKLENSLITPSTLGELAIVFNNLNFLFTCRLSLSFYLVKITSILTNRSLSYLKFFIKIRKKRTYIYGMN